MFSQSAVYMYMVDNMYSSVYYIQGNAINYVYMYMYMYMYMQRCQNKNLFFSFDTD